MKFYCIETEECGYYHHSDEEFDEDDLICPNCYSLLLPYENNRIPIWKKSETIIPTDFFHDYEDEEE